MWAQEVGCGLHAEQSPANEQVALLEARPKHKQHPKTQDQPGLGRKGIAGKAHRSYTTYTNR